MISTAQIPSLSSLAECEACGRTVGWVTVAPGQGKRPVDPEPHPRGEYLLMRDGKTVADVRHDSRSAHLDLEEGLDPIRYFDHRRTCPIPSLRTFAGGLSSPGFKGVYGYDGRATRSVDDPVREQRRATLLEIERLRDLL